MGAAIEAAGPLIVKNCCFLDNEFLRYAPVVLIEQFATLTASENYGNVIGDPNLACDFAISFDDVVDYENLQNFRCVEFDATECAARMATPEPTTPTPEPTILPGTPAPVVATDAPTPTAGASGRAIISLSAAAAALTAYFVF